MHIAVDIPDAILHQLLDPVPLPLMARVRYDVPTPPALQDVVAAVHEQVQRADGRRLVQDGQRIAIGVGSRGIGHLPEIVAALVAELRAPGTEPFIVPAMGSHGGATAQGQREVLAHLGVTPERVGAPIATQLETIEVGHATDDTPVCLDCLAIGANGIVFVGRVKPHTAFRGPYESGLAKMIAIGLGKQAGAAACHARGFSQMARMVPALAEVAIVKAPIRFGLAVLENAHEQPYKLVAVPANRILAEEPALLDEARRTMPRLPFDQLDVLVIDETGKNISGGGADPAVTGRYPTPDASGGSQVAKQVILDLTAETGGNANGLGTVVSAQYLLAHVRYALGQLTEAAELLDRAATMFARRELDVETGRCWYLLAQVRVDQDRLVEAAALVERATANFAQRGIEIYVAHGYYTLARVYLDQGRLEEARPLLAQAGAIFYHFRLAMDVARCHYITALLCQAEGQWDEADALLTRAETTFRRHGLEAEVARCRYALAEVRQTQGQREEAITLLREAKALFKAHGLVIEGGALARDARSRSACMPGHSRSVAR